MIYMYKGITLSKYCKNNGLNYNYTHQKIQRLKELNAGISDDEAVRLAIENNINGNTKYKYQGTSLKTYCQTKGIVYKTVLNQISKLQKANPNLSNEEVVTIVLDNFCNQRIKYMYQGLILSNYCEINGLNYGNIIQRIQRLKKLNIGISDDEVVRIAIENNVNGHTKYKYQGTSLRNYCVSNNLNYQSVLLKFYKLQELKPNLTEEELMQEVFMNLDENNIKYFYEGLSLRKYCRNNNINYSAILQRIYKLQELNPNLSVEELVSEAVENSLDSNQRIKYIYKGLSLRNYCQNNGLNYPTILMRIYRLKKLNVGISDDEVIRLAVENYVNGNTKYKYQGVPLHNYCQNTGLNYKIILKRIDYLKKTNPSLSEEELVDLSLAKKYKKSK